MPAGRTDTYDGPATQVSVLIGVLRVGRLMHEHLHQVHEGADLVARLGRQVLLQHTRVLQVLVHGHASTSHADVQEH